MFEKNEIVKVRGESYRFIHLINSDTAYVSRVVSFMEAWERMGKPDRLISFLWRRSDDDRILVPLNTIVKIPVKGAA